MGDLESAGAGAWGRRRENSGRVESMWACLPAGPLERHYLEGVQGGIWDSVPGGTDEEDTFLEGTNSGKPLLVIQVDAGC